MKVWAIIAAAGSGARLGLEKPKAFIDVAGKPMLAWMEAFREADLDGVVFVLPPEGVGESRPELVIYTKPAPDRFRQGHVTGGETRQMSVRNGLTAVPADVDVVVVHDAARPCVTPELIRRVIDGLGDADASVAAIPVADTLKRDDGTTVSREGLWRAQTPQAFRLDVLRAAHERARAEGFEATDDAQLVEHYGGRVVLVPGDERNIKVTTKADLALAEALLSEPRGRSGIGYDAHAFAGGRALVLGCVEIPHERGLAGHSDADVLAHAIVDALLGAAALGDIGEHFPSSDPRWESAPSSAFLESAARMVADAGYRIDSVDATVVLEEPPIAPYRDEMRKRLAAAMGIDVERVSVKATTTDGIGGVTAGGVAANAVARLSPR